MNTTPLTPTTNSLNANCLSQVPALKEAIENVDSLSATLREKQSLLSDEIAATFDHIVGIVEKRRADVVRDLTAKENAKQGRYSVLSRISHHFYFTEMDYKACMW